MPIARRGVFGCIGVFGTRPEMQCLCGQLVLLVQFVAQVCSLLGNVLQLVIPTAIPLSPEDTGETEPVSELAC